MRLKLEFNKWRDYRAAVTPAATRPRCCNSRSILHCFSRRFLRPDNGFSGKRSDRLSGSLGDHHKVLTKQKRVRQQGASYLDIHQALCRVLFFSKRDQGIENHQRRPNRIQQTHGFDVRVANRTDAKSGGDQFISEIGEGSEADMVKRIAARFI